ncbi:MULTISPECIES: alpha/beta hydrolase [Bradyrhizobium]|uniref:alpha/beta fold hydrolase n=1 Tax=Bradyrhizobium TaxID=374 RepID=UPI00041629F5|nr:MULTISPECIES: alpha/beta hydrolase [Bradyrhizobium]
MTFFEIWSARPIYDAAKIKVPTLVVRGDRDSFADKQLAAKIPGAQETVVVDATHWGPYERNRDGFTAASRAFLSTRK